MNSSEGWLFDEPWALTLRTKFLLQILGFIFNGKLTEEVDSLGSRLDEEGRDSDCKSENWIVNEHIFETLIYVPITIALIDLRKLVCSLAGWGFIIQRGKD